MTLGSRNAFIIAVFLILVFLYTSLKIEKLLTLSMEIYIAGAAAAFTVDMLVYPLDTLKTRYQSQDFVKTYSGAQAKPLALKGLYQGIGSVVLATLPAAGIFFYTYEGMKEVLGKALPWPDPLVHSLASGIAEMASCSVLAPAEVIKQNAQMLRSKGGQTTSTSLQAFKQLSSTSTSRRFFTGYTALVARNLPFTALQFPIFERIRSTLKERSAAKRKEGVEASLWETGLISAGSASSAGAFAAFITTPSDVVKTRMMVTAGDGQGEVKKHGAWKVTQDVMKERGVRGFFRGGGFRSAWTALGSGLYLGTYDVAKVFLKRKKPDLDDSVGL